MSMNQIVVIGNVVKDPEIRYTSSNKANAKFSVAVQRDYKDKDGKKACDFINCVAWSTTAEYISKYISKGSRVCVSGRLQVRNWVDQDNKRNYISEIVVGSIYQLGQKEKPESKEVYDESAEQFDEIGDDSELPF